MEEQTFNLAIEGYWRDKNKTGIPGQAGIYFVYEDIYSQEADTVKLIRVLYVGEAENVKDEIVNHKMYPEWKNCVRDGNELCFSTGYMEAASRTRVRAAIIFKLRPLLNNDYKDSFPFDQTTVTTKGRTALLEERFTVERT